MTAEARSSRPPRSPWWTVLGLVGGMLTGGTTTGAVAHEIFTNAIQKEVHAAVVAHDTDPKAHLPLVLTLERFQATDRIDDAEKARQRAQFDEMQKDISQMKAMLARLEERQARSAR